MLKQSLAAVAVATSVAVTPANAEDLLSITVTPQNFDEFYGIEYDLCRVRSIRHDDTVTSALKDFCAEAEKLTDQWKIAKASCDKDYKVKNAEIDLKAASEDWDYQKENEAEMEVYKANKACESEAIRQNGENIKKLLGEKFSTGLRFTISTP